MPKTKIPAVIVTFVLCMAFWVLITWNFSSQELLGRRNREPCSGAVFSQIHDT